MASIDDKQRLFDSLLRQNRGRFVAIARTYAANESEDLLQEILLQIWRSLDGFQQQSSIDTWCYRVALNTAISWRRKSGRQLKKRTSNAANLNQYPATTDDNDSIKLLQQFIQTLSEADQALLLIYMDELSGAEIAKVLGLSEANVRVKIHRIKTKLSSWEVDQ